MGHPIPMALWGGVALDPSQVPDMTLWFKTPIAGLSDDDPVGTWPDESGNGFDVSNTGASRPTYKTGILNGLPVVRFDGTDDRLLRDGMTVPAAGLRAESSIFCVAKFDVVSGATNRFLIAAAVAVNPTNERNAWGVRASSTSLTYFDPLASWQEAGYSPGTTNFRLMSFRFESNDDLHFRMDRANDHEEPMAARDVSFHDRLVIGEAASASAWFDGDMAELIAYNRFVTTQERDDIEQYLVTKYAFGF